MAPGPHVPTAPFPCQHLQPPGSFGPFSKGETPDRIAAAPCPCPHCAGVLGTVGLWLLWLGVRARSQSQLHQELPQLGGRSRSQQWEEGQSHLGSSGGRADPLSWGGAGGKFIQRACRALGLAGALGRAQLCPAQSPSVCSCRAQAGGAGLTRCAGRTIGHCAALSPRSPVLPEEPIKL